MSDITERFDAGNPRVSGGRDLDGFWRRGVGTTTRLEAFVDAAFAFAVTLLVISVDSIPKSGAEMVDALKSHPRICGELLVGVAVLERP